MVRTRETATVKVVGAKAPRKAAFTPTASSIGDDSSGKSKYSGGNSYCPRETPAWQKNITSFFNATPSSSSKSTENDDADKSATETAPSNESDSATSNKADSSNKENEAASSS